MTSTFKTEQEAFWEGEFGNDYASRNLGKGWVAANTALFSKILESTYAVDSVLEFGSNTGLNLKALRHLLPSAKLSAIEINKRAVDELNKWAGADEVFHQSILEFDTDAHWDLVFTKGVLIHINPDELSKVYELLYKTSNRYILVSEYYNPNPVTISYRGHTDRLFKRDFAGDLLDKYSDLQLVNYGFVYRRDHYFPQDDATWFLLEKTNTMSV